ncbi:MAG: 3-hydroxyisobutyrate dehydrogenase [Pseudomonadota bacterium]
MKIGFIGLGNMGAPMAGNLIEAGHEVVGYDVSPIELPGMAMAATAAEAAAGREAVITMLPDGGILRLVYADIVPAAAASSPKAVMIDCSTVDVESARAAAAEAEAAGLLPVDAPVSGGVGGAASGSLTFMAGGSDQAFARAMPLFEIMGQKAVHCGTSGAGQSAKICNNMILGATMIATCEAFGLADRLGLSRQAMFDVVSTSSGFSWSMNTYCPAPGIGPESPADRGYAPGFAADLMLKDLRLSQQAVEASGAVTPMGARATELYSQFLADGGSGQDFSAILLWLERQSR